MKRLKTRSEPGPDHPPRGARLLRTRLRRSATLGCAAALLYMPGVAAAATTVGADASFLTRAGYPYSRYYDACYLYGRCSADDLRQLRDRMQRLDRVSPQAPEPEPPRAVEQRAHIPPTPVDQIRPEYQGASQLREE